jgi:hypothetical protein
MTLDIGELLHRRSDLSTFVVHLTKDADGGAPAARDNLWAILRDRILRAGQPMGWAHTEATALGGAALESQRVACFTETPLEHLYAMFADIRGRSVHLRGYGLAFTKVAARGMGINPVWYIDMTPGRSWELAGALDDLRERAVRDGLDTDPAGRLFPFIEGMGDWRGSGGRIKEFWWEREWRHRGDLVFRLEDVALLIVPADDHAAFEPLLPGRVIDGTWGLERIIAKLAGVAEGQQETPVSAH